MIGFQISAEQLELVGEVRELMEARVTPYLVTSDQRGDAAFDWSLAQVFADANLICPVIHPEYGGRGLDYLTTALLIEEIAAANPGLA